LDRRGSGADSGTVASVHNRSTTVRASRSHYLVRIRVDTGILQRIIVLCSYIMLFSFIVTRHFKASCSTANVMSVMMSKLIIVIHDVIVGIVCGSECQRHACYALLHIMLIIMFMLATILGCCGPSRARPGKEPVHACLFLHFAALLNYLPILLRLSHSTTWTARLATEFCGLVGLELNE
jgi:hypothetical protein